MLNKAGRITLNIFKDFGVGMLGFLSLFAVVAVPIGLIMLLAKAPALVGLVFFIAVLLAIIWWLGHDIRKDHIR